MTDPRVELIAAKLREKALPPRTNYRALARRVVVDYGPRDRHTEENVIDALVKYAKDCTVPDWKKWFRTRQARKEAIEHLTEWLKWGWAKPAEHETFSRALGLLTNRQRWAFLLFYAADLSHAQIASITEREIWEVSGDVSKAIDKMHENGASMGLENDVPGRRAGRRMGRFRRRRRDEQRYGRSRDGHNAAG